MWGSIIGFIAGFCTTVAFLPQVMRIYQNKSAKDISLPMYIILFLGISLWIVYGLFINSYALIIANCITIILAGAIIVMKLKWK